MFGHVDEGEVSGHGPHAFGTPVQLHIRLDLCLSHALMHITRLDNECHSGRLCLRCLEGA